MTHSTQIPRVGLQTSPAHILLVVQGMTTSQRLRRQI
jgi:hypothetical protein